MEFKKLLTPWNWFKKEEEQTRSVQPVSRESVETTHPVVRLQREIDQIFDNFFRGFPFAPVTRSELSPAGFMLPRVDIGESRKQYTITVEIPGVDEKDIELTVEDGTLTIRGEKRSETVDEDEQFHRVERTYGAFQRVISLPTDADEDHIQAKFKNGVLTITIPKRPEAKPPVRRIAIS